MNYKRLKQYVARGKKLNPTVVENDARLTYGRDEYIKGLAKDLDVSAAIIYAAFSGNAPLRLYIICAHLKSLKNSIENVSDNNNKVLE